MNGGEVFKDCLFSLSKIIYTNWELVVVDNGSSDKSETLPPKIIGKKIKFKLIKNKKNLGFAKANNQGYKISKGKYLLLLNNDTKLNPDFLNKLVDKMEADLKVGVIQPKIFITGKIGILDNAGSFLTKIGFLKHWGFMEKDSKEFSKETEILSAKGACMLVRKKLVDKIGLFDESFFSYFEESDFCWRVNLSGSKVIFFPNAAVYHKIGYTIRRLNVLDINFHYYKNRICSLIKNLEMKNLTIILISHLVISTGLALFFLLGGKFSHSFMIVKAILWNVTNLRQTLIKRKEVQKLRKITDQEMFKTLLKPVDLMGFYRDFRRIEEDLARK